MNDENEDDKKLEAIEKARAERRKGIDAERKRQLVVDMTAVNEAEEKWGVHKLKVMKVARFVPGLPTLVVIRSSAGESFHRRYVDMIGKAKSNKDAERAAGVTFAKASLVYPDPDTEQPSIQGLADSFPNMWTDIANAAMELCRLEEADEKKE